MTDSSMPSSEGAEPQEAPERPGPALPPPGDVSPEVRRALEAILFVADEPLSAAVLGQVVEVSRHTGQPGGWTVRVPAPVAAKPPRPSARMALLGVLGDEAVGQTE